MNTYRCEEVVSLWEKKLRVNKIYHCPVNSLLDPGVPGSDHQLGLDYKWVRAAALSLPFIYYIILNVRLIDTCSHILPIVYKRLYKYVLKLYSGLFLSWYVGQGFNSNIYSGSACVAIPNNQNGWLYIPGFSDALTSSFLDCYWVYVCASRIFYRLLRWDK
jgi:hypothetical protein